MKRLKRLRSLLRRIRLTRWRGAILILAVLLLVAGTVFRRPVRVSTAPAKPTTSTPTATAAPTTNIALDTPTSIVAGQAWTLQVNVSGANPGDTVTATLLDGLKRQDAALVLGSGGIAVWRIPSNVLTVSGTAIVFVHSKNTQLTRTFQITPAEIGTVEALSTANKIVAYGLGRNMIIGLAYDLFGNAVDDRAALRLSARYADGRQMSSALQLSNGLAWSWLSSAGVPGRVVTTLALGTFSQNSLMMNPITAEQEFVETPDIAATIDLQVQPTCVPPDGRTLLTLSAYVKDTHNQPVSDGTRTLITWAGGSGAAPTINGIASLRIPAPAAVGSYSYQAVSGNVTPASVLLRVTDQGCQ
jgi:hypothetical protein